MSRPLLTARDALVGIRVRLENEIRGPLKSFGIMFGERVGGFMRRAEEVIVKVAPELQPIFETLVSARHAILERIRKLDTQVRAAARRDRAVRLFMTAPGVGPITGLGVASAFDDPARFRRSSSAGAYLGLTPRRYESGEVSYNGRSSKRGDRMTRTYLYEAANSVITRNRYVATAAGVGRRHRQENRAKQGARRARTQARCHSPRDVADRLGLRRACRRVTLQSD